MRKGWIRGEMVVVGEDTVMIDRGDMIGIDPIGMIAEGIVMIQEEVDETLVVGMVEEGEIMRIVIEEEIGIREEEVEVDLEVVEGIVMIQEEVDLRDIDVGAVMMITIEHPLPEDMMMTIIVGEMINSTMIIVEVVFVVVTEAHHPIPEETDTTITTAVTEVVPVVLPPTVTEVPVHLHLVEEEEREKIALKTPDAPLVVVLEDMEVEHEVGEELIIIVIRHVVVAGIGNIVVGILVGINEKSAVVGWIWELVKNMSIGKK